jgi:hypothetical protein
VVEAMQHMKNLLYDPKNPFFLLDVFVEIPLKPGDLLKVRCDFD